MHRLLLLALCLSLAPTIACDDAEPCGAGLVRYAGECLAEPPACGEAPTDCLATLEATGCAEAGGAYDEMWRYCNCGTTDGGCPCWSGGHCQGFCLGDQTDVDHCRATTVGTCSDSNATGCLCIATFDEETGEPWFNLVCLN